MALVTCPPKISTPHCKGFDQDKDIEVVQQLGLQLVPQVIVNMKNGF